MWLPLRRLSRSPGFTLFAILSLGIAIGLGGAAIAVVESVFWPAIGLKNADKIFSILTDRVFAVPTMSALEFRELREQQSGFEVLAASCPATTAVVAADVGKIARVEAVSGDYFSVIGAVAKLGRVLNADDDRHAHSVVIVSDYFWRTRLNSDPAVIGRAVLVGGQLFSIVGVVKGPFHGLLAWPATVAWFPLSAASAALVPCGAAKSTTVTRQNASVVVWGRLKSGITPQQASAELSMISRRLDADIPLGPNARRQWTLSPNATVMRKAASFGVVSWLLLASVAILLLTAFVNVAGLTFARTGPRLADIWIQSVLGASRRKLIGEFAIENAIVVLGASLVSSWVLPLSLRLLVLEIPYDDFTTLSIRPEITPLALGAAALSVALAIVITGLWPAWRATRHSDTAEFARPHGATLRLSAFHSTIISWQICGSITFSLIAVICLRTTQKTADFSTYRDYERSAVAWISFEANGLSETRSLSTIDAVLTTSRADREISVAEAATGLPNVSIPSPQIVAAADATASQARATVLGGTSGSISLLGMSMSRGSWPAGNIYEAPASALIEERLGRSLFGSSDVLARLIRVGGDVFQITGTVESSDSAKTLPIVMVPIRYGLKGRAVLMIQGHNVASAVATLRTALHASAPLLSVDVLGTGLESLQRRAYIPRTLGMMSSVLAGVTLLLAVTGLCGVMSIAVTNRAREIGIRLAIGASTRSIVSSLFRSGALPVLKGIVIGTFLGLAVPIVSGTYVFLPIRWAGLSFIAALACMYIATSIAACLFPAIRATRISPIFLLRDT